MNFARPIVVSLLIASVLTATVAATQPTAGQLTVASTTKTFKNPVYPHDFPDPFILKAGKTYYAYGTQSNNEDIPTLTSTDLVHWKAGKDALPVPPFWAVANYWAPAVFRGANGKYVLWFAAQDNDSGRQCIGFAVGSSPAGPFKSRARKPTICQTGLGGSIDPDVFKDKTGQVYVLWKNDGNCCGITTWLWAQKADKTGTVLQGKPVKLDSDTAGWEGGLIEAPFLWKHGKSYFLFFSANGYAGYSYAVGYATCKTPMGPCKDSPKNPILTSKCRAAGPGGETIITDAKGQDWMAYHAWRSGSVGYDVGGERQLWIDRLSWPNGKPLVHGPTCTSQPAPAT
jgi:beta-xylosidase